jgi:T-complex protein 1 subunit zeta
MRAVTNAIQDQCVIPGAGAFEIAAAEHLHEYARKQVSGKQKLGVHAFAEALIVVPRTLAQNSGFDAQETLLKVQEAHIKDKKPFGVDVFTGEPLPAATSAVWDNYIVKR